MAGSLLLQAYLGLTRSQGSQGNEPVFAPRPKGAVIWAICHDARHLGAMATLTEKLADDGEDITIIATSHDPLSNQTLQSPNTRKGTRAFLDHWQPQLILWVGGQIDPAVAFELGNVETPKLLVDAKPDTFALVRGRGLPGMLRRCLSIFDEILTAHETAIPVAIRASGSPKNIRFIGLLEDGVAAPHYDEAERATLSQTVLARPVWVAANLPMQEMRDITTAYLHAARRAHRTLLILVPKVASDGEQVAQMLRDEGLGVARRRAGEKPRDSTQILVADTDEGLGLWCRLAPITFLGGSLSDGAICDPFIPAMVGSAVLIGPNVTQANEHYDRLLAANAISRVTEASELGPAIENLLATDHAASQALAAWDVTSRGADATNELVTTIYTYLDKVNG